MIFEITPFALDKRYGKALNEYIRHFPDDSWICVRDRDTMYLTSDSGRIMEQAIVDMPDTACFTCNTNRLAMASRCYRGKIEENDSIIYHKAIAKQLAKEKKYTPVRGILPGFFWLFPKRTWIENPFDELKIVDRMKTFDIRWSEKITGKKVKIEHLYLFHDYRLGQDRRNIRHLL